MTKGYFIPSSDTKRLSWILNFNKALIDHATALALLPPALLIVLNDKNAFQFMVALKKASKSYGKAATGFLSLLSNGPIKFVPAEFPTFEMPASVPPAVPDGIFPRCAILAKQIKANGCSQEMALALGIVGTGIDTDFSKAQPTLKLFFEGGLIKGKYKRGQLDGVHVECMRGNETVFSYFVTATKTTFVDSRPNLIAGQPETRHYRLWYIVKDEVVGIVSADFSITVAA
jgi:hypothetical protein